MDTVTLSNGLKALFGTSQSTATNIPTCAADGTPAGNISVANLASVLGVSFMTGTAPESGYDLNNFKVRGGFMRFNNNTVNAPVTGWGIVIALSEDEGRYFHIAFCYNGAYAFSVHTRFFHGNTWEAWKQFSLT